MGVKHCEKYGLPSALNDTVEDKAEITFAEAVKKVTDNKKFHVLHDLTYEKLLKNQYTQSEVDAIRSEDLKFIKLLQNQLREQPTNDNAFVWTDALVVDILNMHRSSDEILAKWVYDLEAVKRWKDGYCKYKAKQSAPEPSALPTKEGWEIVSFKQNSGITDLWTKFYNNLLVQE